MSSESRICYGALVLLAVFILAPSQASCNFLLGPEELVQASGVNIDVPGYSVPAFAQWDGDGLPDLIVGEGSGTVPDAKVRVYLNAGTPLNPQFTGHFYAQSEGSDLSVPGSG